MGLFNQFSSSVADAAYSTYLDQIIQVKNTLMYGTKQDQYDEEMRKYFLKVKGLGLLYIGLEQVQAAVADNRIKKYYSTNGAKKASDNAIAQNKVIADKLKLDIVQHQKDVANYAAKIKQESGINLVDTEPTTNPQFESQVTSKRTVPTSATQLYANNEKASDKTAKAFREANANSFKSGAMPGGHDVFPTAGEPVAGHDEIGLTAASQTTYDVGGTPNQPKQKLHKSWARVPTGTVDITATPLSPLTDRLAQALEAQKQLTPGSYRFFIEKLHGRAYDGNYFKKGPIEKGLTPKELPNRMVFPAYVSRFNDSYDVQWESYNFIGRGESVHTYKGTERSLTIEFQIVSDFSSELLLAAIEASNNVLKGKQSNKTGNSTTNKKNTFTAAQNTVEKIKNGDPSKSSNLSISEEDQLKGIQENYIDWGDGTTPDAIPSGGSLTGFVPGQISGTPEMLYERMTFLAQCCYGWYRKDGKLKEQPFVRIRLGDFFDVVAKVNSLQFTEDEFDLDLNPSSVGAIPMIVTVSMNLTIVHEDEASSEYRRFYHRRDYDKENSNYIPDSGKSTSTFKDGALDNNQSKSPLSFRDRLSGHKEGTFDFPSAAMAQQDSLKGLSSDINNLKQSSTDNMQSNFEKYANPKIEGFNTSLKDINTSSNNLNDVKKKERLRNLLVNAKRILDIKAMLDAQAIPSIKEFKNKVDDQNETKKAKTTSLANTPISETFQTATIPKKTDLPEKDKALFPKFKTPSVPPFNPFGQSETGSQLL